MHPGATGEITDPGHPTFHSDISSVAFFLEAFGGWPQPWEVGNGGGEPQSAAQCLGSSTKLWPEPFAGGAAVSFVPVNLRRLEAVA